MGAFFLRLPIYLLIGVFVVPLALAVMGAGDAGWHEGRALAEAQDRLQRVMADPESSESRRVAAERAVSRARWGMRWAQAGAAAVGVAVYVGFVVLPVELVIDRQRAAARERARAGQAARA